MGAHFRSLCCLHINVCHVWAKPMKPPKPGASSAAPWLWRSHTRGACERQASKNRNGGKMLDYIYMGLKNINAMKWQKAGEGEAKRLSVISGPLNFLTKMLETGSRLNSCWARILPRFACLYLESKNARHLHTHTHNSEERILHLLKKSGQ